MKPSRWWGVRHVRWFNELSLWPLWILIFNPSEGRKQAERNYLKAIWRGDL
jgi:hypothetical protein